jgi:hypothetical protein
LMETFLREDLPHILSTPTAEPPLRVPPSTAGTPSRRSAPATTMRFAINLQSGTTVLLPPIWPRQADGDAPSGRSVDKRKLVVANRAPEQHKGRS